MASQLVRSASASSAVLRVRPLRSSGSGFGPWETRDPFLFCVHHHDRYPRGNSNLGPAVSLSGRELGRDFSGQEGWSMYHGEKIPGFPAHPHRGFETVTVVRQGFIDHSDSLGATARFGNGDTQWVTTGKGIVHSEMFPLLDENRPNPLELFQIWLNLPAKSKMVDPYFTMLWNEGVPRRTFSTESTGSDGKKKNVEVVVIAGALGDVRPLSPPPDSWASQPEGDVAIWTIALEPGSKWTLPASGSSSASSINRTLHVFVGDGLLVEGREVGANVAVELRGDSPTVLEVPEGKGKVEILMLQGRPIDEPVAQRGPFVMNTQQELQQAFADYQRTQFGGWPFRDDAPVHPRNQIRFAKHPGGRIEDPTKLTEQPTTGTLGSKTNDEL